MRRFALSHLFFAAPGLLLGAPELLDNQFELPTGFHIYKVAERELTGGSYDLVIDGGGRLLVGDGQNLRRLADSDGDQVYDESEIIAEGLGGRGPQGLTVYGDNVYAVGGDGMQLFSGYRSDGTLKHEGRLGAPFNTGGDHAAHTVLRGLDGYLYHVTGDGGGVGDRKHITEESSPVLFERNASVFRFDPTGAHWECIAAGGRNPPSLGMNYLGEFFSFDSDMEWHVDLPFYRPVRLNHWATGSDQGWQGVGAYPPYYLDCLPGVLEVGRGSPNWGIFYEHQQFPEEYRDAFLACDYQWKSATSGGYAQPGRLVAFEIERAGATWKAEMSVLAQPKEGAVDANGQRINFGPVDVDVAPDGSIVFTDHNQGVWRIFYDESEEPEIPQIVPEDLGEIESDRSLDRLLRLPQPIAEWTRVLEEQLVRGDASRLEGLHAAVFDKDRALRERLRAVALLATYLDFDSLAPEFIEKLAGVEPAELRGQAAWLAGIRGGDHEVVLKLLKDEDPFVRRRAAEAISRVGRAQDVPALVAVLSDDDRFVAYAAMTALAHRPTSELTEAAENASAPAALMRLLVATELRRERPAPELVQKLVARLFDANLVQSAIRQELLDFLRVLGLFRQEIVRDESLKKRVGSFLLGRFPHPDPDVRWEQIRLIGQYDFASGFPPLLRALQKETDNVTKFHIADALAKISSGWTSGQSAELVRWLQSTQSGWFAEPDGKGRQFPGFWNTVVTQLASRHAPAIMEAVDTLEPGSQLATVAYKALRDAPNADRILLKAYRAAATPAERERLLDLLRDMSSPVIAEALLEEYGKADEPEQREQLITALAGQPVPPSSRGVFVKALTEVAREWAIEACANRILSDGKGFGFYEEALADLKVGDSRGEQAVSFRLIELMTGHTELVPLLERTLQLLAGHERPSFQAPLRCIWTSNKQEADDRAWFAKSFEVDGRVSEATLVITCDNEFTAFLNGREVAEGGNWEEPQRVDVSEALRAGTNIFAVVGMNQGGPAGLSALLPWTTDDGASGALPTDATWKATSAMPPEGWLLHGAAEGAWRAAVDVSGPTENVMDVMARFMGDLPVHGSAEIREYWQSWYRERFGQPFLARPSETTQETLSDEKLHALITGMETFDGDAARGREIYLKATCFACHGGVGDQTGTLFGPSLSGVTLRLNRSELADAIVYPSKLVPDRFKATELTLVDGSTLNGFLTEQSDEFISITDLQNEVTRLPRSRVTKITSQKSSLMPAKLLTTFSESDVRDLMVFINGLK